MEIVSPQQFLDHRQRYYPKIRSGAVFIYPTDTIYGIGCDATNGKAVNRIRRIKHRSQAPFSVAVPSRKWVEENCELSGASKGWLQKLPGPYTLVLKLKNRGAVAKEVVPEANAMGVRIPKNWFSKVVAELGFPVVSTSANISSQMHMTSISDLSRQVARKVDFIIYEGAKSGRPSTIVKLNDSKPEIVKR